MDFRSAMNQVKQFFVIGKDNPYLHGRQQGQADMQGYEQEAYQPPQQSYAPNYAQQGYQQPQPAYQQPQQAYPPYPQGAYQAPMGDPYQQQAAYQAAYQPPQQPEQPSFQSQFNQESFQQGGRNRRSAQHHEQQAQAAAYQQPAYQAPVYQAPVYQAPQQPQQPQAPENLVPFPGTHAAEARQVDAYVINVFNLNSCRQAMTCLRRGQCTLIVMDQLIDKSEIRRYVDMLTGACYALGGTMTRLSAKIGFYIMAPSGMTVYTDPTTSNANAQPRPQQAPVYRAPQPQPQTPSGGAFTANSGYGAVPQMTFSASQGEPARAPEPQPQPQAAPAFGGYEEYAQRYQAQ